MQITFKTVEMPGGKKAVEYSRDGKVISRQETDRPLQYIASMLNRIANRPHIITDINVTIIGVDVPRMN